MRQLLDDLHSWQSNLPDELAEPMMLADIRWHMERIVDTQDGFDKRQLLADLSAVSEAQLEVLLEMDADWHQVGDDAWSARAPKASTAGAAGGAHLDSLRRKSSAPIKPERSLTYLVQLLRDPAYQQVPMERKLHQLTKVLIAALVRDQRAMETGARRGRRRARAPRGVGGARQRDGGTTARGRLCR